MRESATLPWPAGGVPPEAEVVVDEGEEERERSQTDLELDRDRNRIRAEAIVLAGRIRALSRR